MERNNFINNTVVEVLNRNHALKIINEYNKTGFGCSTPILTKSLSDDNGCRYIGVVNGEFGNYSSTIFYEKNIKKLTLNELIIRVNCINKLPKNWYIKGCEELKKYLNNNNIQAFCSGSINSYGYYDNGGCWNCNEVIFLQDFQDYHEITLQQYLDSLKPNNNNTNTNKMKSIEIPEDYEINLQKLIELGILTKPVQEEITKTYDDILKTFKYQIASFRIHDEDFDNIDAFIKLLNTAKYLNKIYEKEENNEHYFFYISHSKLTYALVGEDIIYDSSIYFYSKQAIEKAKEILGEETIKLALKFN